MKRVIAMLMVVVTLLTTVVSLAGCGATTKETALSMGQWVTLIAESFGMQNYVSDTPYFKNVKKDSVYFDAFQMAAEWEILEPSDSIRETTSVKWKDVMVTLVNAGGFLNENATEEEKIAYGVDKFGIGIRKYWMNRYIKVSQAIELLDTAQRQWAERPIENPIHEATFAEEVKDHLKDDVQYTVEDGKFKVPAAQFEGLASGDIFTLPACGENPAVIKKVTNVVTDGEYAYIEHEDVPDEELEKVAETVVVRDSTEVDFNNIVGIYDENGNPIVFEDDSTLSNNSPSYSLDKLVNTGADGIKNACFDGMSQSNGGVVNTGIFDKAGGEYTFTIKGNKITLSLNGKSFGIKWSKDSNKKSNQYRDTKSTTSVGVTCDHIRLDKDIDISWGKLKSAMLKIDYKTTIQGGIKITTNNKVGKQDADGSEVRSSLKSIVNGYKDALSKIDTGVRNTKYNNESVYICRIKVWPAGFAAVDFIVKGVVTVTGEMKIVIEVEGCQGIEYKNGKARYIKSKGIDTDFMAEGKIEATISPGFAVTVLEKWVIGEILVDFGAGVSMSYKAHLFDAEMHHVHTESGVSLSAEDIADMEGVTSTVSSEELAAFATEHGGSYTAQTGASVELFKGFCFEWKLYPIIRVGLGDGLLPNILKSTKLKLSWEILGSSNPICSGHRDFDSGRSIMSLMMDLGAASITGDWATVLGVGNECTLNFVPWDSVEETLPLGTEEPTIDHSDILTTESITLDVIRVTLLAGESTTVSITGLPAGYTVDDVTAKSEDKKIATIDTDHGKVTAHDKTGTTLITVMTKDGKYQTSFAVTVVDEIVVDFSKLEGRRTDYGMYGLYETVGSVFTRSDVRGF